MISGFLAIYYVFIILLVIKLIPLLIGIQRSSIAISAIEMLKMGDKFNPR